MQPSTSIRSTVPPVVPMGLALLTVLVSHIALREMGFAGGGARLALTVALILAMLGFVAALVNGARSQDEYHRRVHLDAVAIAFPIALVLVFAVGYLRGEGMLAGRDPRDLWLLLLLPYGLGLLVSLRRYR